MINKKIAEAIKSNNLVFFVGAGFSNDLKFPDWENLVINILNNLDDKYKPLIQTLKNKIMNEIEVLEKIKSEKATVFNVLKEELKITEIRKTKLENHKKLWSITDKIITTNYDKALDTLIDSEMVISYENKFEVANLGEKYLFKLHGDINNSADCVLFEDEYKNLYSNGEKAPIFKLKNIIDSKTIIFIGFSLNDVYVNNYIFKSMKNMFGEYRDIKHFILTTNDNDFSEYNIKNILLDSYNEIPNFLDELIKIKEESQSKTESIQIQEDKPIKIKKPQKTKIVILISTPIDQSFDYSFGEITKSFKKFDVELDLLHLSIENLNDLENFDYILIFTKNSKNKAVIENEDLSTKIIELNELIEEVFDDGKIYIFIDKKIDSEIKQVEISNNIRSFFHKTLKSNLKKGLYSLNEYKTKLPYLISERNLTNFIGRERELKDILKITKNLKAENKILTIKGSGGIGKTTIIKKVALELSKRGYFEDGIYFIECEHLSDYKSFEVKISQAFEIDSVTNLREYLSEHNFQKDSLIILDNFETLLYLDETNEIKDLVEFISEYSNISITSREFLGFVFEEKYDLKIFSTDEAEELFNKLYKIEFNDKDRKFFRDEILENLLNNNPLAIKLITNNLPSGKNIYTLKEELEKNFFEVTNEELEEIFDREADLNIEKSKSLFQSINYSYSKLKDSEKLAFEILSLFPDGINLEKLKEFFKSKDQKGKKHNFSDKTIKSLEDKSLIENSNGNIKLQSIIGRFAEYQFNKRDESQKEEFYKKAFEYNKFMLDFIINLKNKKPDFVTKEILLQNSKNFFKVIDFIDKFKFDKIEKLMYIDSITTRFTMFISSNKHLIQKIENKKNYFNDIENAILLIEGLIILLNYYDGNFNDSYKKLNKILSFEVLNKLNLNDILEKYIVITSLAIYSLEGNHLEYIKFSFTKKVNFSIYDNLVKLGSYYFAFKEKKEIYFELKFNTQTLNIEELKKYIKSLHPKDFINLMENNYILAKTGELKDKNKIDKFVITNFFTIGLKKLMLAFIEEDICEAEKLYIEAIENLEHIKYYFVEAIYFYAKFLKENSLENYKKEFDRGYSFAKEFHYRFLEHQFNNLRDDLTLQELAYKEEDYPLPELDELDIEGYINMYNKNS